MVMNLFLQAESHGHEVIDEIYTLFSVLLSRDTEQNDFCFKSYCIVSLGFLNSYGIYLVLCNV